MPVSVSDFIIGLSAASAKPYFLDSYLGVYGKSIMDGDSGQNDFLFGSVLFILILVGVHTFTLCWLYLICGNYFLSYTFHGLGSLSTQLAESTYNEIKKETEKEKDNKNSQIDAGASSIINGSNGNNSSMIDIMGLKLEIPQAVKAISDGFLSAGKRVDSVIEDEVGR